MSISHLNRRLSRLSLLAIPLVSLFGVTSVSAATPAPEPADGKIILEQGVEYDGFTIPANTTVEGNGATIVGKVTVDGDNVTIDHVNFSGNGGSAITAGQVAKNLTISNNIFTGYSGPTITLGGGDYSGLSIINNRDDNINANNIQVVLNTAVDDIAISGNHLSNTLRVEGYADSLTTGIVVSGNIFAELPLNAYTAISIVKANGATINGNKVTTASGYNGNVFSLGELVDSTLSKNEINIIDSGQYSAGFSFGRKDYADKLVGPSSSINISGNTITGGLFGMNLTSIGDVTIDNNTIKNSEYGIIIGTSSDPEGIGNIDIKKGNDIEANTHGVHINAASVSMGKEAKVRISSSAKITGAVANIVPDDTEYIEVYAEPTTEEPTDQPTTGDQTAPDVTAPNTGAHHLLSTLVSAIALVAFIVASATALSYVAKSFKK